MEFFRGLSLLASHPRLWARSITPLLWALVAYAGLGIGIWIILAPRASRWAESYGLSGWLGGAAVSVLLVAAWVLLFSTLFIAFAGVFGGLLWDRLAADVEELDGGAVSAVRLSGSAVALDTGVRLVLATVVGIAALVVALLTGPVGPFIAWASVGFLGQLDYSAPASLRRGWTLLPQMRRVLRGTSCGFAAVVGVISLLPLINLLLWPAAVAGGTLLVRRLDDRSL